MTEFYERHMLRIELLLATLSITTVITIGERFIGRQMVEELLKNDRQALYGTASQVSASLLGFILAAVTILLSLSQARILHILRQNNTILNYLGILWCDKLARGDSHMGSLC